MYVLEYIYFSHVIILFFYETWLVQFAVCMYTHQEKIYITDKSRFSFMLLIIIFSSFFSFSCKILVCVSYTATCWKLSSNWECNATYCCCRCFCCCCLPRKLDSLYRFFFLHSDIFSSWFPTTAINASQILILIERLPHSSLSFRIVLF